MSLSTSSTGPTTPRVYWWAIALATLVSLCGLVIAVQQLVLKYLWDQSAHTRTIGGIGYMLLGIAGICLPILLLVKKRQFLAMRPSRQNGLAFGVPLLYVMVFACCLEMSQRSTTLLLPRPFTPTAVVRYDSRETGAEFRGGWRMDLESGASHARPASDVNRFSARLYQSFLRHPRRETVKIDGSVENLDDGDIRITLDVDAQEPVRIVFENLESPMVAYDGPSKGRSVLQAGKHRFTVTGRPKGQ